MRMSNIIAIIGLVISYEQLSVSREKLNMEKLQKEETT